jgi:CheY-like chemotaxis protein
MPRASVLFIGELPSTLNLKSSQDEQSAAINVFSGVESMTSSGFFMLHSFPQAGTDYHSLWHVSSTCVLVVEPDLQVIYEVADGLEEVQKPEVLEPDLILLDVGLPKS